MWKNIYQWMYVSVTDWCYSSIYILYFYISQSGNKLLIVNNTYFLERQIPHSVSHPLRSQDSVSKSIQLNAERSKSGWRWVYLRFFLFILLLPISSFSPFPSPLSILPFLNRIIFRKFIYLITNYSDISCVL